MEKDNSFDNIELISISEVIEEYYRLVKDMVQNAATLNKNNKKFDTFLCPDDELTRRDFLKKAQLSHVSEALIDLVVLLEWQNSTTQLRHSNKVLYDAILRFEIVLKKSSAWELVSEEEGANAGPVNILTYFEVGLMERVLPPFAELILEESKKEIMFFPLTNQRGESAMDNWRILEKLATMQITSNKMQYHEKVLEGIRNKLQNEVNVWIEKQLSKVKGAGKGSALKDLEAMSGILHDLTDHLVVAADVIGAEGQIFVASQDIYFDIVAEAVQSKLYPACERTMQHLDQYHDLHKNFHENMRESSALCHSFYLALKNLVQQLKDNVKRQASCEKMTTFHSLFGNAFLHLLHALKSECHFRISNAAQLHGKEELVGEPSVFTSAVVGLNCLCTVLQEWQNLEIVDEELRIAFLIKITDTICDGAKIFAEAMEQRIGNVYTFNNDPKCLQQICIVANSIEHIRWYLFPLPERMKWDEVLSSIEESNTESSVKEDIRRILVLLHESMNDNMLAITNKIAQKLVINIRNYNEKFVNPWLHNTSSNENADKLVSSLHDYLHVVHKEINEKLFFQVLHELWLSFLSYVKENFQEGQRADYAKNVKQNITALHEYLLHLEMKEDGETKDLLQQVLSSMEINSKSTVELQLNYFGQLADLLASPLEYLGHLAFQAGYKITQRNTVAIFVRIQKGQRLPVRKYDIDHLTVTVELCPTAIFPSQRSMKTQPASDELDNPVFDETFQFLNLHSSVLTIKGAVIHLLVQNQDCSFCAEAVLNLDVVQNMSNIISMDFLPVYLMPLRVFDRSHPSFRVLESRSKWDRRAKSFVNKRLKVTKSRKTFSNCVSAGNHSVCGVFGTK